MKLSKIKTLGRSARNPELSDEHSIAEGRHKSLPLMNEAMQIKAIENDVVIDYSNRRFVVWEVDGVDSSDDRVMAGWSGFVNSLENPAQIIIRQHLPDLRRIRLSLRESRPENMREGHINDVANSLLTFLEGLEREQGNLERHFYVVVEEGDAPTTVSLMLQTQYGFDRLEGEDLEDMYRACASGMGIGHDRDYFQMVTRRSDVQLNRRFARTFELNKWPRRIDLQFIEGLLHSGDELDISFFVLPVSIRESGSTLRMQEARWEGVRMEAQQKQKVITPETVAVLNDVKRLAEEVEKGVSRLYRVTLQVTAFGELQEDVDRVSQVITNHFRSRMAGARVLKFRQTEALRSMMPAGRRGLGALQLTDTGTMLRLFPFAPPDLNTGEGIFLGRDLRSRSPVIYDRFNRAAMNGHTCVMARSGGGKSFFTKLTTVRETTRSVPVYIVDPDGEYGAIANALGGRVFVPGKPGFGLNPFMVKFSGIADLSDRQSSLCSLIGVMMQGDVDHELEASIDASISRFYRKELREAVADRKGNDDTVLGRGGIGALYQFLKRGGNGDQGEKLGYFLERFAQGTTRFLLSGEGDDLLSSEAPVTTFNMRSLQSNLKPVATSVCSEVVWGLAISDPRSRLLVVDECWTVLATPSGAAALLQIAKRARKYLLGLMAITQDVQDFLGEGEGGGINAHAGRALLQNSATKIALSQDPGVLSLVAEALGLNADSEAFLRGVRRGQGLLIHERGTFPIEIVSTKDEFGLLEDRSWLRDGENADPEIEEALLRDYLYGGDDAAEYAASQGGRRWPGRVA